MIILNIVIFNINLLAYNINLLIHYAKGTLLFIQLELLIKLLLIRNSLTVRFTTAHVYYLGLEEGSPIFK